MLSDGFRKDSDIDVLVQFAPDVQHSLFDLAELRHTLEGVFRRPLDMVENALLRNPFRRNHILRTAGVLYAPEERDLAYLWDMLQASRDLLESARGLSFPRFSTDRRTRFAVERQLLVIGEAAGHVSDAFREAHPEFPWGNFVGQRNVPAHDHGEILVERSLLVTQ